MGTGNDETLLRHAGPDRLFHWLTAATLLVLLGTSFLPIAGVHFAWLVPHWLAGLLLTLLVAYHVVRAVTALNVKAIRLKSADLAELKGVKPGKYSLAQKAMHKAWSIALLIVIATGLLLMIKAGTPVFGRNGMLFSLQGWGVLTLLHDGAALLSLFLVIVHVYFGLRPEKRHYLESMLRGQVSRAALGRDHDLERVARGE